MISAKIDFQINPNLNKIFDEAINIGLTKSAILVQADAIKKVPVKMGTLRKSIDRNIDESKKTAEIFIPENSPASKYASLIELFGAKPHEILPRFKKALWWKGLKYPIKRVYHPGFQARPFLRPALYDNKDNIVNIMTNEIKKATA
jgi:HK97 gp10 family phage protein